MFEYYCNRNVTNGREYNEREMLRWLKQKLEQAHRDATEEVAKAHKCGWEQCQREAKLALCEACCYNSVDNPVPDECSYCNQSKAIASMEYKEPTNV